MCACSPHITDTVLQPSQRKLYQLGTVTAGVYESDTNTNRAVANGVSSAARYAAGAAATPRTTDCSTPAAAAIAATSSATAATAAAATVSV